MGNQLLLKSNENHELERFYHRFSVIQRDTIKNVMFMEEKKTGKEFMLRELTTNDEFQTHRIENLVREKRTTRNKYLLRLEDHFFERDKTSYCSNQFKAYLLFESHYKDLCEEILERRIKKSYFEEEELVSVVESAVMALLYLRQINHPHECVSSSSILINKEGIIMLSDPWLNSDQLQLSNHVYKSPEQLEAAANISTRKVDWFTSDLYSLGVVILEAYHLEFMDDIYMKNSRAIKNELLRTRVAAIRTTTLKKYVEQLVGSPNNRISISEEIYLHKNKQLSQKYSLQPQLISSKQQSNIPKETIDFDRKRLAIPPIKPQGMLFDMRATRTHPHAFHHHLQHKKLEQPQYLYKNTNQPTNLVSIRKQLHMPTVADLPQIKFTNHQNNIGGLPQTTTNANNPINMQNGHNAYILNQLLTRTNANLLKPYFPIEKTQNTTVIQARFKQCPLHNVRTVPSELKSKRNEQEPLKQQNSQISTTAGHIKANGMSSSMISVKKNHSTLNLATPIEAIAKNQPVSNFLKNKVNRSMILSNGTKNGASYITNSTEAFAYNNQKSSIIQGNSISTTCNFIADCPSSINKIPPPLANTSTSKITRKYNSPDVHNQYTSLSSHSQKITNHNIATSSLTSAQKLQMLLSQPMSPADLDLFTKPELLEGIYTPITYAYNPQNDDIKNSSKLAVYKQPPSDPYLKLASSQIERVGDANDFISSYIDREIRQSSEQQVGYGYGGVTAETNKHTTQRSTVVPPLTLSSHQYPPVQSDRTNTVESSYKYRSGEYDLSNGADLYTFREIKTERIVHEPHLTEVIETLPSIRNSNRTINSELYSAKDRYVQLEKLPQATQHSPKPLQMRELQRQKSRQEYFIIAAAEPLREQIKSVEASEIANLTQSQLDRQKQDKTSYEFGQLSGSHQQKYLLSYDMEINDSKHNKSSIDKESINNTSNSSFINAINMIEPQPPTILLSYKPSISNFLEKPSSPEILDNEMEADEVTTPTRSRPQLQKYNSTIHEVSENSNQIDDDGSEYVVEYYDIGSRYQGYKKNGMRNGKGKFYYQDGGFYEGEWKDNKMHGEGKLYYSQSKLAYEGEWYLDEFHGHGKVYNDNPVISEEPFNYQNFSGLDEYWVYYQGNLVTDTKEGIGRLKLSNGQVFEGEFRMDRIEGNGKFYTMSGNIITGLWKDSKLVKAFE